MATEQESLEQEMAAQPVRPFFPQQFVDEQARLAPTFNDYLAPEVIIDRFVREKIAEINAIEQEALEQAIARFSEDRKNAFSNALEDMDLSPKDFRGLPAERQQAIMDQAQIPMEELALGIQGAKAAIDRQREAQGQPRSTDLQMQVSSITTQPEVAARYVRQQQENQANMERGQIARGIEHRRQFGFTPNYERGQAGIDEQRDGRTLRMFDIAEKAAQGDMDSINDFQRGLNLIRDPGEKQRAIEVARAAGYDATKPSEFREETIVTGEIERPDGSIRPIEETRMVAIPATVPVEGTSEQRIRPFLRLQQTLEPGQEPSEALVEMTTGVSQQPADGRVRPMGEEAETVTSATETQEGEPAPAFWTAPGIARGFGGVADAVGKTGMQFITGRRPETGFFEAVKQAGDMVSEAKLGAESARDTSLATMNPQQQNFMRWAENLPEDQYQAEFERFMSAPDAWTPPEEQPAQPQVRFPKLGYGNYIVR